ncbi:MAG: methylated-DNA--[protein]-cysteine S-methyltransferase [Gammaproteobacteria bacterium]|nr:methylated-DNA--[protein]-cysteine S-methyltransferase [Gammaproteobacteria bacterium]
MNKPANQYSLVIDSPLGRLGILILNQQIHRIDYLAGSVRLRAASSAFERRVVQQLGNYFDHPGVNFTVPFELAGTPFQQRVWMALTKIPAGETLTYGELADKLGSGARAVGNACRHNPVSILVPCHRVVAASGIGGYSGSTSGPVLDRKRWLLEHESQSVPALKKPAMTPDSQLHRKNQRNIPA